MRLNEARTGDVKGATPLIKVLPEAEMLIGNHRYEGSLRYALQTRGASPTISLMTNRKTQIPHDHTPTAITKVFKVTFLENNNS